MTITTAVDYTTFSITSDLIDAWIADDTIDVTLNVYESCGSTPIEIVLSDDNETGGAMVITPTLLEQTGDAILDGIYRLELVSDDGDEIITEKYCLFIDNELKCNIVEYLATNLTSNIYHLYMVLSNAETCVDCNCSNLCTIYDEIVRLIDTQTDGCTTCS